MAGLGDYSKKGKGNRGYKMKGPSLLKMVSALKNDEYPTEEDKKFLKEQKEESVHAMDYLTKTPVGPRATVKPIDRDKFEEYTSVMQGMENVREELFSAPITHDIVKENIKKKKLKNKKKDKPVKPKEGDMKKYSDLEKYDDDK